MEFSWEDVFEPEWHDMSRKAFYEGFTVIRAAIARPDCFCRFCGDKLTKNYGRVLPSVCRRKHCRAKAQAERYYLRLLDPKALAIHKEKQRAARKVRARRRLCAEGCGRERKWYSTRCEQCAETRRLAMRRERKRRYRMRGVPVEAMMNVGKKEEVIRALRKLQRARCCYGGHTPCDCKYGYADAKNDRGEECGCPELRSAILALTGMTETEWSRAIKRNRRVVKGPPPEELRCVKCGLNWTGKGAQNYRVGPDGVECVGLMACSHRLRTRQKKERGRP